MGEIGRHESRETKLLASIRPMMPANQKHCFQPNSLAIQPITGANTTREKYCEELKIEEARPRSVVGNHAATMRPLPGKTGAWAKPERNRKAHRRVNATATGANPTSPDKSAQIDQHTMLMPYTRFEPNRSRRLPAGNCANA